VDVWLSEFANLLFKFDEFAFMLIQPI
jgi:hypothetical protein